MKSLVQEYRERLSKSPPEDVRGWLEDAHESVLRGFITFKEYELLARKKR